MARTTKLDLRGDRVKARAIAEAHVNRLLFDFRRNQSFQNLAIYSETKKFFDQSGRFVGTVYMQSVNGAEDVVVHCLSGEQKQIRKERIEIPSSTQLIVPVMIGLNKVGAEFIITHFVACLSGTFEPEYYVFKNTQEFQLSEFDSPDSADLDEKKIADGDAPIRGSSGPPSLFFINQTGINAPYKSSEWNAIEASYPQEATHWTEFDIGCISYESLSDYAAAYTKVLSSDPGFISHTDYLEVGSETFELDQKVGAEIYPEYRGIRVHYYHTDSIAGWKCIFSANLYSPGGQGYPTNKTTYHIVDMNATGDKLIITEFEEDGNVPGYITHNIPGIKDEDGNLIEFYGEIFLARISYNNEPLVVETEI